MSSNSNRSPKRVKSSPSGSQPVGRSGWRVILDSEFTHPELTPLSNRAFRLAIILETLARQNPFLWHGNKSLMKRTGWELTTLRDALRDLVQAHRIVMAYTNASKRNRVGIIMARRTSDGVQVADTPERIEEATIALRAHWRPTPSERYYRWRNSAISDGGIPPSGDVGIPHQNKEEGITQDEGNHVEEEQAARVVEPPPPTPSSSLAITLSGENSGDGDGEDDAGDDVRFRDGLRSRLDRLTSPGGNKHGLINVAADDLSRRLLDDHSKARYCKMLRDVVNGATLPSEVLEAFEASVSGLAEGKVGVMGSYFFGAIGNMRSDRAHEEIEAEHRAGLV